MNPDSTSNSNLPQPAGEPLPVPTVAADNVPAPQAQPSEGGGFSTASPAQALQQLQAGATDGVLQAQPIADEDNVVLDKEWIDKAKQIVIENQADPYEQNRRLAEVKADYLQKRYGKTIKLAE